MRIGKYKISYEEYLHQEGLGFSWAGYYVITFWGAKPPHSLYKTFRIVPSWINKIYKLGKKIQKHYGFNLHYTDLPVRWFFLKNYRYHKKYDYGSGMTLKWFLTGYKKI